MKAELIGEFKSSERGMSTLEIMIAFALIIVAIVGALDASFSSRYWALASETSNEGLYKAKTVLETIRANANADFESASSTLEDPSMDATDSADQSCISGGLCYYVQSLITNYSSCAKFAEARVQWKVAERYPTTTTSLYTNLANNEEVISLGGDCLLNGLAGAWDTATPSLGGERSLGGQYTTGIDVLQGKIYVTASSTDGTDQFRVYGVPTNVTSNPSPLGSTPGKGLRLNAVDAIRDLATGRTYAFITQHSSTTQLAVVDTTDASAPAYSGERSLYGVDPTGSFPEGWLVFAYGTRLYVTTRETTGPELHIFNISTPISPTEIVSAATELNRTVTNMIVREEKVNGSVKRYLFLSSRSDTKELAVFDVTNDTPIEVTAVNLSGVFDGQALTLLGDTLYVGRTSNTSGAELFAFNVKSLIAGDTTPLGSSEIGGDVISLRGSGKYLYIGTSKSGSEIEVRTSDPTLWSDTSSSIGRYSTKAFSNLAPLGLEVDGDWLYGINQSAGGSEKLSLFYTP